MNAESKIAEAASANGHAAANMASRLAHDLIDRATKRFGYIHEEQLRSTRRTTRRKP